MDFSAKEIEYLSDFDNIISSECNNQLDILKTITKLMFCLFKQISQFQFVFAEMKKQIDQKTEESIEIIKQEIKTLDDNIKKEEIHQSISQIRQHINDIENQKFPTLIDEIERHKQELFRAMDNNYVRKKEYEAPIFKACKEGELSSVQWLIEKENVDKNQKVEKPDQEYDFQRGDTPIHIACKNGHLQIVQYLIEKQMVDKEINNLLDIKPLHYACLYGHLPIVQYLISKGANVEGKDKLGSTPLHYACNGGHLAVVKYLVSRGAYTIDNYGNTPLHSAARHGKIDIVRYLISVGANKQIKNNSDHTPYDLALNVETRSILK